MHGRWNGEGSRWIQVKVVQLPALMGTPLMLAAAGGREGAEPGEQCWGLPGMLGRAGAGRGVLRPRWYECTCMSPVPQPRTQAGA